MVLMLLDTGLRGGRIGHRGERVRIDRADLAALLADRRCELLPVNTVEDFAAGLLPQVPAPPSPVQLRWISGNSSRLIDGVSRHLGDLFATDPTTAAALIEDKVAERVDA